MFWPFWGPFGETEFNAGTEDAYTVFHQNNFNFTGPLILIAAVFVLGYWSLSGKKWFKGPKVQGTKEELLAIERELDVGGRTPGDLTERLAIHR